MSVASRGDKKLFMKLFINLTANLGQLKRKLIGRALLLFFLFEKLKVPSQSVNPTSHSIKAWSIGDQKKGPTLSL